jgi:hypothetical protein
MHGQTNNKSQNKNPIYPAVSSRVKPSKLLLVSLEVIAPASKAQALDPLFDYRPGQTLY